MNTKLPTHSLAERVERELERERQERILHDEARTGISASEELRVKDARTTSSSAGLKRPAGR